MSKGVVLMVAGIFLAFIGGEGVISIQSMMGLCVMWFGLAELAGCKW